MSTVTCRNLVKRFGDVLAVNHVNLDVKDGEFVVLVGPSGCGKTTTLRMIAGLEGISGGEVLLDGEVINGVPPRHRDMAMVFQNYALYPHMKVFDNIAYSLKLRRMPRAEIERRVNETARLLNIGTLLGRWPRQLSGGQRQRVALGRAIVRQPRVFLMDEPLSNLDAQLRVHTRREIIQLQRQLGITTIYVTHDQVEAMTMGDRIVVMKDGLVQQAGEPDEVYRRPRTSFVARFIGSPAMNIVDGELRRQGDGLTLASGLGSLELPGQVRHALAELSRSAVAVEWGLRPEDLAVVSDGWNDGPVVQGVVDLVEHLGADSYASVRAGEDVLLVRVSPDLPLRVKDSVKLGLNLTKVHLFDKETGASLLA